jgi:hypothetical protein
MPDLPPPRDPRVARFLEWLRGLDADELDHYAAELEGVAGDGSEFGAFAAAALPLVDAVCFEREAREHLRAAFEEACPDADFDQWAEGLAAAARAQKQLHGRVTDPLATLDTAFAAATARDGDS